MADIKGPFEVYEDYDGKLHIIDSTTRTVLDDTYAYDENHSARESRMANIARALSAAYGVDPVDAKTTANLAEARQQLEWERDHSKMLSESNARLCREKADIEKFCAKVRGEYTEAVRIRDAACALHETAVQNVVDAKARIEHLVKRREAGRTAARRLAVLIGDLGAFVDDNDPRIVPLAGPIGEAQADLWIALDMDCDKEHARQIADIDSRCAVCGWPLAESVKEGCVRGNCSYRPRPERLYAPERAAKEESRGE